MKYAIYLKIFCILTIQTVSFSNTSFESNFCANNLEKDEKQKAHCELIKVLGEEAYEGLTLDVFKATCSKIDPTKFYIKHETGKIIFDEKHLKMRCDCLKSTGQNLCDVNESGDKLTELATIKRSKDFKFNTTREISYMLRRMNFHKVPTSTICDLKINSINKSYSCMSDFQLEEDVVADLEINKSLGAMTFNDESRGRNLRLTRATHSRLKLYFGKGMRTFKSFKKEMSKQDFDLEEETQKLLKEIRESKNISETMKQFNNSSKETYDNYKDDPIIKRLVLFNLLGFMKIGSRTDWNKEGLSKEIENIIKAISKSPEKSLAEIEFDQVLKPEFITQCEDIKSSLDSFCGGEGLRTDEEKINILNSVSAGELEAAPFSEKDIKKYLGLYCLIDREESSGVLRSSSVESLITVSEEAVLEMNIVDEVQRLYESAGDDQKKKSEVMQLASTVRGPDGKKADIKFYDDIPSQMQTKMTQWKGWASGQIDGTLARVKDLQQQYSDIISGKVQVSEKEKKRIFNELKEAKASIEDLRDSGLIETEGEIERSLATISMWEKIESQDSNYKPYTPAESKVDRYNASLDRAKSLDPYNPNDFQFDDPRLDDLIAKSEARQAREKAEAESKAAGTNGGGSRRARRGIASSSGAGASVGGSLGSSSGSGQTVQDDYRFVLETPEVKVDEELKKLVKINDVYVFDPVAKVLHYYGKDDVQEQNHELIETFAGTWVLEHKSKFPKDVVEQVRTEMYRVRDLDSAIQ